MSNVQSNFANRYFKMKADQFHYGVQKAKRMKVCYIRNLEDFNTKLREQRHDYLNQLQIVHGLLELDEFEEAKNYLQPVFRDIMKVNQALKTSQPAVNALLRAKMEAAEQQGVDLYVEIATQLNRLPLEPWEFCKILANLIDNAVTAAGQNEGEKRVLLQLKETPLELRQPCRLHRQNRFLRGTADIVIAECRIHPAQ